MARIDPDDPRAPYIQIADDLRKQIAAGELAPGKRMGSSRELAAAYGVAPMTVHQAVRVLRDEGLVESWQGRGVFVRAEGAEARPPDVATQVQDLRERVEELWSHVDEDVAGEVTDLRRQVGLLQAQLMELYARVGQQYPHDQVAESEPPAGGQRRRKASGS